MGDPADDRRGSLAVRASAARSGGPRRACWLPFVLLIVVFVLGFLGLAYSLYPYVVLEELTSGKPRAARRALKVILVGVCISVPAIAGYTVFYRVFRGKTGS